MFNLVYFNMNRNLRTEGFMKGIKIIDSCYKQDHFKTAEKYINNFRTLFGKETFGGEYTRLLILHLRERITLSKHHE